MRASLATSLVSLSFVFSLSLFGSVGFVCFLSEVAGAGGCGSAATAACDLLRFSCCSSCLAAQVKDSSSAARASTCLGDRPDAVVPEQKIVENTGCQQQLVETEASTEAMKQVVVEPVATREPEMQLVETVASTETMKQVVVESVAPREPEPQLVETVASTETMKQVVVESVATREPEPQLVETVASTETMKQVVVESVATRETEPQLVETVASTEPMKQVVVEPVATWEPEPQLVETVASTEPMKQVVVEPVATREPEPQLVEMAACQQPEKTLVGSDDLESSKSDAVVTPERRKAEGEANLVSVPTKRLRSKSTCGPDMWTPVKVARHLPQQEAFNTASPSPLAPECVDLMLFAAEVKKKYAVEFERLSRLQATMKLKSCEKGQVPSAIMSCRLCSHRRHTVKWLIKDDRCTGGLCYTCYRSSVYLQCSRSPDCIILSDARNGFLEVARQVRLSLGARDKCICKACKEQALL